MSTTITSCAWRWAAAGRAPVGATEGSTCAMASSEVRMPWPIAVPRAVDRPVRACSSAPESAVGGTRTPAVPANATRPMRGPPASDLMKALAAFSAAVIRFGLTSVEHMEPETSRASMIVAGLRRDRHGGLRARRADAEHGQPEQQQRRGDEPAPAVAAREGRADERDRGHAHRPAAAPAPRPPPGRDHQRDGQQGQQGPRPGQRHSDHPPRSDNGEDGARGEKHQGQGDERARERQPLARGGEPELDRRGDAVQLAGVSRRGSTCRGWPARSTSGRPGPAR